MAIVNIDNTVEITSPAVGIGVEMIPISRGDKRNEFIMVTGMGVQIEEKFESWMLDNQL